MTMTTTNQRAVEVLDLIDRLREAARDPYGAVRDPQARASIATEAADALEALRTPGWRPISEAPKDGQRLLVSWPASTMPAIRVVSEASSFEGGWYRPGIDAPVHPTHFMPLPPPPGVG